MLPSRLYLYIIPTYTYTIWWCCTLATSTSWVRFLPRLKYFSLSRLRRIYLRALFPNVHKYIYIHIHTLISLSRIEKLSKILTAEMSRMTERKKMKSLIGKVMGIYILGWEAGQCFIISGELIF